MQIYIYVYIYVYTYSYTLMDIDICGQSMKMMEWWMGSIDFRMMVTSGKRREPEDSENYNNICLLKKNWMW